MKAIEGLTVPGGHEIVLVNDGSADGTRAVCEALVAEAAVPIVYVEHARNFGEHNAVLTGWRHARGAYVVNLDDDGQNDATALAEQIDQLHRHRQPPLTD